MRYVYGVKASLLGDPFIAFSGFDEAMGLVVSMNKDMDAEDIWNLIVRIPIFKSYETFGGGANVPD